MKKETDNSRPGSLMIFLLIVLDKKYLKVLELKAKIGSEHDKLNFLIL